MSDIVMPRLSDSMEEGTVVRWLKAAGEHVARGEPLVEIETDKATITYESDLEGVLTLILVREGETVPVGQQIAMIEAVGAPGQEQQVQQQPPQASGPPPLPVPPAPEPQPGPGEYDVFEDSGVTAEQPPVQQQVAEEFPLDDSFSTQQPVQQQEQPPPFFDADTGSFTPAGQYGEGSAEQTGEQAAAGGRVKASPVARRLARKLGVDVAHVNGTGPGGRVVKEDVERAADAAAAASQSQPTQAPAPEYAYEPGGSERHEDDMFSVEPQEPQPLPLPPDEFQITPPATQQPGPPAPTPQPPAPTPPQPGPSPQPPTPTPQPAPGVPPQPTFQPQPSFTPPPPQPQQPFPGPPPFVQGMTGNFGAIPPQPQQPPQQQPPQQQTPQQQPPQQPAQQQAPPQGDQAQTATRGQSTPVEPTTAQRTVARRMAESKATAPEFFVETEVDMTMAVNFREQLRSAVSPVPSFNDFVIKAAAQALRQYPNVNAAYKDGHFEQYSDVNIGVVVSATELLAVPTLFNVDQKGLAQIARESHDLSEAVRNRTIQPAQLSGGTFSVSNLGMYGVERFTAILNPPQAAILAVGAINRRAVIAEDGMSLVIRQIMNMTLTCDHRILYGAEAAEFLGAIKAWLENPQMLQV